MEVGKIVHQGPAADLAADPKVLNAYLGGKSA
jgi:ABC-type branched-subunit amino acid transport system ATPase component